MLKNVIKIKKQLFICAQEKMPASFVALNHQFLCGQKTCLLVLSCQKQFWGFPG